jgi:TctA family transporter
MIGAEGRMSVFWSNGLVGSITTLAIILLFWPLIEKFWDRMSGYWKHAEA